MGLLIIVGIVIALRLIRKGIRNKRGVWLKRQDGKIVVGYKKETPLGTIAYFGNPFDMLFDQTTVELLPDGKVGATSGYSWDKIVEWKPYKAPKKPPPVITALTLIAVLAGCNSNAVMIHYRDLQGNKGVTSMTPHEAINLKQGDTILVPFHAKHKDQRPAIVDTITNYLYM